MSRQLRRGAYCNGAGLHAGRGDRSVGDHASLPPAYSFVVPFGAQCGRPCAQRPRASALNAATGAAERAWRHHQPIGRRSARWGTIDVEGMQPFTGRLGGVAGLRMTLWTAGASHRQAYRVSSLGQRGWRGDPGAAAGSVGAMSFAPLCRPARADGARLIHRHPPASPSMRWSSLAIPSTVPFGILRVSVERSGVWDRARTAVAATTAGRTRWRWYDAEPDEPQGVFICLTASAGGRSYSARGRRGYPPGAVSPSRLSRCSRCSGRSEIPPLEVNSNSVSSDRFAGQFLARIGELTVLSANGRLGARVMTRRSRFRQLPRLYFETGAVEDPAAGRRH